MTEDAATLGCELCRRRKELGLSHEELSTRIRIGRSYLIALEEDRHDQFPGEAYLIGFLRNYAQALGLDPNQAVARLRQQSGPSRPVRRNPTETDPAPAGGSRASGRRLSVAILILFLISAAGALIVFIGPGFPSRQASPPALEIGAAEVPPPVKAEVPPASDPSPSATSPLLAPAGPAQVSAAPLPAVAAAAEASPPIFPAAEPGVLRLVGQGRTDLEISIDAKPPQRYILDDRTVLEWTLAREARLRVGEPGAVRLWLGEREIAMEEGGELLLTAERRADPPEEKP